MIIQSPGGTSQASMPSADMRDVRSIVPSLGTTWLESNGVVSGTRRPPRRTPKVLAITSVRRSLLSGRSSSISIGCDVQNVSRIARTVMGFANGWYLRP